MARLDIRTFIRATPERIWELITDLSGQEKWMVDVRDLEIVSEQQSGVGTVVKVTSMLFGLPVVKDTMEITGWNAPRELIVAHTGQFTGSGGFELTPVRGGTVFLWWEEFNPPLGPVGELAFRLVVRPHMLRMFARSMDNVKQLAEA